MSCCLEAPKSAGWPHGHSDAGLARCDGAARRHTFRSTTFGRLLPTLQHRAPASRNIQRRKGTVRQCTDKHDRRGRAKIRHVERDAKRAVQRQQQLRVALAPVLDQSNVHWRPRCYRQPRHVGKTWQVWELAATVPDAARRPMRQKGCLLGDPDSRETAERPTLPAENHKVLKHFPPKRPRDTGTSSKGSTHISESLMPSASVALALLIRYMHSGEQPVAR